MCDKIGYPTVFEAQKVISQANHIKPHNFISKRRAKRRQPYKPKRAYKCEECNMWHLTSQKKKHKNKRIKR